MSLRRAALGALLCAVVALVLQARAQAGTIAPDLAFTPDPAVVRTPLELRRAPEQTFLTYPEWFLVYSPEEYADLIVAQPPSRFPYLAHIGQLWQSYRAIALASSEYRFNMQYHVMIIVIATSTTAEYSLKGAYDVLIGRVAELFGQRHTREDVLAARVARAYVDFLDVQPWYRFDFLTPLRQLWTETGVAGVDVVRKLERKHFLTAEYLAKAVYAGVIKTVTQSAYGVAEPTTAVVLDREPGAAQGLKDLRVLTRYDDGAVLATVPRYQAFTDYAETLSSTGISFVEIAGNVEPLLVSVIIPDGFDTRGLSPLFTQRVLTRPGSTRILFTVPVSELSNVIRRFKAAGLRLEHVYDY